MMKSLFLRYALKQLISKTSERLWVITWAVGRGLDFAVAHLTPELSTSVQAFRDPLISFLDLMVMTYVPGRISSKAVKGPQGTEIP